MVFRKYNQGGVLRMNALSYVAGFFQILEIVLKPILYIAVIYILFGPLAKLMKAALIYLNSQKSNTQTIVTDNESIIPEVSEQTSEEE